MSVTAKNLISATYASNTDHSEYTTPNNTRTIVDKFTATNQDSVARTLSINIIPSGDSVGAANLIVKTTSIAAGATFDSSEMKNQILSAGDIVSCVASVASMVVIRMSGRECT